MGSGGTAAKSPNRRAEIIRLLMIQRPYKITEYAQDSVDNIVADYFHERTLRLCLANATFVLFPVGNDKNFTRTFSDEN